MPRPTGPTDVLVVGAGIHGAAAARALAEHGARVTVLERGTPAGGPTGRSSAICRAYYTDAFLASCARESISELSDGSLAEQAGFRRTGGVYLHGAEDVDLVRTTVPLLVRSGADLEFLDPVDAGGVVHPDRSAPSVVLDDVAIAVWEPGAGYADPHRVTHALLEQAGVHGAIVEPGVGAVAVESLRREVRVRCTDGSTRTGGRLLIAAGPWTAPLARTLGVTLPLTVERHTVLVCDTPTRAAVFVADVPRGYYLRPDGARQALIGGLLPGRPTDPDQVDDATEGERLELLGTVAARFPAFLDASSRTGWASLYDVSPDWQPVIGEIAPHVFVDAGTSGHGFKLAPALGRHVADLVLGLETDPALTRFSPNRFERREPLAAGFGDRRILG